MKPILHSRNSARKFGGTPEDYIEIHNFFDTSKAYVADMRHRVLYHHSQGIYMAERLYGYPNKELENQANKFNWSEDEKVAIKELIDKSRSAECCTIVNSDGKEVSVRDVGEQHVLEDLGTIPSLSDCIKTMPLEQIELLGAKLRKTTKIKLVD